MFPETITPSMFKYYIQHVSPSDSGESIIYYVIVNQNQITYMNQSYIS